MRGITLVELLICTIIVSIMTVGIFAGSLALQKMNNSITDRSALYIRTQRIVDTITNDAVNTTGTSSNTGICINNQLDNDNNYICFRNALNWACYTRLGSGINRVNLYRCTQPITASCSTGSASSPCASLCGAAACVAGSSTLVDTLVYNVFAVNSPAFSNGVFTMPVINRVDPTGGSGGSMTNPQVAFEIIAYPEGHSF
ncbi:MAG: hypothetical protein HQL22_05025 [Candidatus Omnitrophica bacterium]|nr:hypothetical protein [Candidatus Omnitrophota bacterium]